MCIMFILHYLTEQNAADEAQSERKNRGAKQKQG